MGKQFEKRDKKSEEIVKKGRNCKKGRNEIRKKQKRKKYKAKRKVESKLVKYIHQEDYQNIAQKGEFRENIDIAVSMEEEQGEERKMYGVKTNRPLHTLGTYLMFWKVFCKILSAGKRTFFPRELDKAGSIYGKLAIVYQVQRVLT